MQFDNYQEIVQFAIDKEIEAAEFYAAAADEESMKAARETLLDFAKEERKHQVMLEKFMQDENSVSLPKDYKFKWITDIRRSDYLVDIDYTPGMGYRDLLLLAMKREEKALKLYNELLKQAQNPNAEKVFKMLCQEEAKHKLALETLYDDHMAELGD